MPRGGARPGAGKPKGCKHKKTIQEEIALAEYKQEILRNMGPLVRAQLNSATGLTVMLQRKMVKDKKTGKFERTGELVQVKDPERVKNLLEGDCVGNNWYYITTKDPNVKALEDIFSRVFGKPKEQFDLGLDKEALKAIQETNRCILEAAKKVAEEKYKKNVEN